LQDLPREKGEMLARASLDYASQASDEVYKLSKEERQLIDEGLTSPLVSEEDMERFWKRHA
jgi:hypothetical protein